MKLTVLIPVYNEVKTILQAIEEVEKITVPDKEVIIIDNFSTDGTRELLQGLKHDKYKIIFNDHNTVSGSLINGMKMAKGDFVYSHHSDLEYDASDALRMLEVAEQGGYDVVIGSRLKGIKGSIWGAVKELRKDLHELEIDLPKSYVSKNDLDKRMEHIETMFQRIYDKIERVEARINSGDSK